MSKSLIVLLLLTASLGAFGQKTENPPADSKKPAPAATPDPRIAEAAELARKSLAAHGGDALRTMKTLVVKGSADISGSPSQVIPATFVTIFSGDKYRFEIINSMQPFKQVYDGSQTVSSLRNFVLPPVNRLGLALLQRMNEAGYTVTPLPDGAKKKGFRITSPEGYFTDFSVDEKTFEIKGYEASYDYEDRKVTTSVEVDKLRDVNGIKIPEKYSQRFELGFVTIYSNFKAKDILVNSDIADDVFTLQ